MDNVKPIYIKFLIAAAVIFVIGTSLALSDLYEKVGRLEHDMVHGQGICGLKHLK